MDDLLATKSEDVGLIVILPCKFADYEDNTSIIFFFFSWICPSSSQMKPS